MPNEVTINIESSLAAMAFVIADQQQHLKEMREQKDESIETLTANYNKSLKEKDQEIKTLHKKLGEKVDEAKFQKSEAERWSKFAGGRQLEAERLQAQLSFALPPLEWYKWDGVETEIPCSTFSGHQALPFVVVLAKITDSGQFHQTSDKVFHNGDIVHHIIYLYEATEEKMILPSFCLCGATPLYFAFLYLENVLSKEMTDILAGKLPAVDIHYF